MRIGRYEILGVLGRGGMGVVYEAEQQNPRRKVAVKVVRGGRLVDESLVKMFQREAHTLARLKHPAIAGIYEAGRTDAGQHFFAMELVRGETLDVFMRKRPPVTRAELQFRLALFGKIADAVHYAHQRGVIHRDLKPSNIVVVNEGGAEKRRATSARALTKLLLPEIKILDFGLARITEGDAAVASMTTEVGVIKGTLPYMSPEQARGDPDQIDLRTDVYALGVILYEMLTGRQPYDVFKKSVAEAVRVICEEPPRAVSRALAGAARLDPDVETIIGKALEKEADRRYASASALAEDVERHLDSRPIMARPPSTIYQLRKFTKRNKLLVGAVVTVFLVLMAGVAFSTSQYLRAEFARRTATASLGEAEAVNQFLRDMLASANPYRSRGETITVRQALDEAAEKVDDAFTGKPLVEAAVRATIGYTYRSLGASAEAETQLEKAVRLRRQELGSDHPRVYDVMLTLAYVKINLGRPDEAVALARQVVVERRQRLGELHPETLQAMYGLAHALWGQERFVEAARLHRQVLEDRRRVLGEDHIDTLWSMHNLGLARRDEGRIDGAEALFRDGLRISHRTLGDTNPLTLEFMNQLGEVLVWTDRLDEAEPLVRKALDLRLQVLGENHWSTVDSLVCLGNLHRRRSDFAEAERLLRRAVAIAERVQSPNHRWALEELFDVLLQQGKVEEARPIWDSWVDTVTAIAARPGTGASTLNHGAWWLLTVEPKEWRDPAAALAWARRATELPDGENAQVLDTLALAYFRTGDTANAVRTQERAIAALRPDEAALLQGFKTRLAEYRDSMDTSRTLPPSDE